MQQSAHIHGVDSRLEGQQETGAAAVPDVQEALTVGGLTASYKLAVQGGKRRIVVGFGFEEVMRRRLMLRHW